MDCKDMLTCIAPSRKQDNGEAIVCLLVLSSWQKGFFSGWDFAKQQKDSFKRTEPILWK